MIEFMTYDQALMWSRFERIFWLVIGTVIVALAESMLTNPTWIFTGLVTFVGQILVFKCWVDMSLLTQPHKNCWAFEREEK
jgi:hypothetical protein